MVLVIRCKIEGKKWKERTEKNVFPTSLMKMILSTLNLVRKIGVCITSEENLN
jgi:hypothetical protein